MSSIRKKSKHGNMKWREGYTCTVLATYSVMLIFIELKSWGGMVLLSASLDFKGLNEDIWGSTAWWFHAAWTSWVTVGCRWGQSWEPNIAGVGRRGGNETRCVWCAEPNAGTFSAKEKWTCHMHSKCPAKVRSPILPLLPQHPTVLCIQWAIIFEATSCHSVVPSKGATLGSHQCCMG